MTADQLKIEQLERELAEAQTEAVKPLFSINEYDEEGDWVQKGIFIHLRHTRLKIGESVEDMDTFIAQLQRCREHINLRKDELDLE